MILGEIVARGARVLSGCHSRWLAEPTLGPTIYFANHSSHLDALIIWSSLPYALRQQCRMVAAADYWTKGPIRRWIALSVFQAVPIERNPVVRSSNPLAPVLAALDEGYSLIFFPEGGRQVSHELAPFRAGLWHVSQERPDVSIRPVWLENLNRIMPKGEILPLPLIASAIFGAPLNSAERALGKSEFLMAARNRLLALRERE